MRRRTITKVEAEQNDRVNTRGLSAAPGDAFAFLRGYPPFDTLEVADVERVAASAEVEFFLAGATIFSQNAQPVEHLRVVRTGAVEIILDGRALDMLGAGELFGHASMLSGLPPGFSARALEDTLCYRIPESVARVALAQPASVGFVARSLLAMHETVPDALVPRNPAPDPANQPVVALLRDPPLLCSPETTIREAAASMTAAAASSIVIELGDSLGILTDRDLRSRVVAEGVPHDDPVSSVMSAPAYTVEPDRLGGDVLLEMLDRGVRHFPVVAASGEVIGVVEATDLLAVETLSPFHLRRAIARADGVAEIARAARELGPAVVALHRARVAASSIAVIYSVVLDAITRRLIELAQARPGSRRPSSPGSPSAASPGGRRRRGPTSTAQWSGMGRPARRSFDRTCTRLPPRWRRGSASAGSASTPIAPPPRTCCSCARLRPGSEQRGAGSSAPPRSRR